MSNKKSLMEKYGQFGFQPDMEGFAKVFNNTYIRKVFLKVFNGDDVLLDYNKENLIAETTVGFDQEKRLVLKEIKTLDYQPVLMNIAVDNISECISHKRGRVTNYLFIYNGMTYSFSVIPYSEKFEPKTFNDEVGQAITSISTQDLLKTWESFGFEEMNPQDFYDVFTVEGTHILMVDIWVMDHYLTSNGKLKQNSTLLKNKIKNVYFRHEVNEDGTENIIVHKGKAKGEGGYDSDFVIVVPCDQISGCIYRDKTIDNTIDSTREIQFAFNNVVYSLEYKQEVK
jgi:hypothetical protein